MAAITLGMSTNAAYVEPAEDVPSVLAQSPNSTELVSDYYNTHSHTKHLNCELSNL